MANTPNSSNGNVDVLDPETGEMGAEEQVEDLRGKNVEPSVDRTVGERRVPAFLSNIYRYDQIAESLHGNRAETFDIGAEGCVLRVTGKDTYNQGVQLTTPGEKRAQYEWRISTNVLALREMGKALGKRPVCPPMQEPGTQPTAPQPTAGNRNNNKNGNDNSNGNPNYNSNRTTNQTHLQFT
jgi:hypothetical protein